VDAARPATDGASRECLSARIEAVVVPDTPSVADRRREQRAPPGVECTEGVGGSAVEAGGFVPGGEYVHDQRERPLTATGGSGIVAR
jgi:hypothetical protein